MFDCSLPMMPIMLSDDLPHLLAKIMYFRTGPRYHLVKYGRKWKSVSRWRRPYMGQFNDDHHAGTCCWCNYPKWPPTRKTPRYRSDPELYDYILQQLDDPLPTLNKASGICSISGSISSFRASGSKGHMPWYRVEISLLPRSPLKTASNPTSTFTRPLKRNTSMHPAM